MHADKDPRSGELSKQETKLADGIVLVLARRLNTQEEPMFQFKSKHRKSQCFTSGVNRNEKKVPKLRFLSIHVFS